MDGAMSADLVKRMQRDFKYFQNARVQYMMPRLTQFETISLLKTVDLL